MTQDETWNGAEDRSGKDGKVRGAWHSERLEIDVNADVGNDD